MQRHHYYIAAVIAAIAATAVFTRINTDRAAASASVTVLNQTEYDSALYVCQRLQKECRAGDGTAKITDAEVEAIRTMLRHAWHAAESKKSGTEYYQVPDSLPASPDAARRQKAGTLAREPSSTPLPSPP